MLQAFEVLIVVSMLGVVAVLLGGLSSMVTQGESGAARSNRLMVARCAFQGATLGLLAIGSLILPH